MDNKQGLVNFTKNIKPIMEKCRDGKRLTKEEQRTIVQYYLEVIAYIEEE